MAGIYIHIPFCRKKCDYCNFFSLATSRFRDAFTDALLQEIELTRDYLPEEPIETIYFGGGTPSLLSVNDLSTILEKAQGTEHRAQGTEHRAQGAEIQSPIPYPESRIPYPASRIPHPVSRIPNPASRIPYPVSRIPNRGSPEITMELNPEDVTREYLALLSQTPVNRLSLGVQSFFDDDLRYLGRNHTAQQAMKALENLLEFNPKTIPNSESRIPNPASRIAHPASRIPHSASHLSLDLIYGIPTLSNDHWRENLNRVISLGIPHISAYALTVEEKTPLAWRIRKGADGRTGGLSTAAICCGPADGRTGGPSTAAICCGPADGLTSPSPGGEGRGGAEMESRIPDPVSDDQSAEQFGILMDVMEQAGYVQYEISNFCLPGYESRHNSAYWKGIPYLGLGPSAHSFNGSSRRWSPPNLSNYIRNMQSGTPRYEVEILTPEQQYNEYVMTSIRTSWGCDTEAISTGFGSPYETHFRKQAKRYLQWGYLEETERIIRLTRSGKFLADKISAELFL